MRQAFPIVLFFLSVGCSDPCDQADFDVEGLCVIQNGYSVNPSEISWIIHEVEREINVSKKLDLSDLLDSNNVSLSFVDEKIEGHSGATIGSNIIQIVKPTNILDHDFLIGHELLHVISLNFLDTPKNIDMEHKVPFLFCEDQQNTIRSCGAIETDLWNAISERF